jgi:UDPglucose--hexose-1-phosphate uridylyltransferase
VPPVAHRELSREPCPICEEVAGRERWGASHRSRVVAEAGGWAAWATWAPSWPFELLIAPDRHLADLGSSRGYQPGLVRVLKKALTGLDLLFASPMPYMLWCHQKPVDGASWPRAHVHFHVAPAWRKRSVVRYVASGELGSGVTFNPVDPEDAAAELRRVLAVEDQCT